LNFI
jgi:hypothetical protein